MRGNRLLERLGKGGCSNHLGVEVANSATVHTEIARLTDQPRRAAVDRGARRLKSRHSAGVTLKPFGGKRVLPGGGHRTGTARRKSGVLDAEVEPYRRWLLDRGYTSAAVRMLLRKLSHLGVWRSTTATRPALGTGRSCC